MAKTLLKPPPFIEKIEIDPPVVHGVKLYSCAGLVVGDLKELEGGRTSISALSLEGGCISFISIELNRRSERATV